MELKRKQTRFLNAFQLISRNSVRENLEEAFLTGTNKLKFRLKFFVSYYFFSMIEEDDTMGFSWCFSTVLLLNYYVIFAPKVTFGRLKK